MCHLSGGAQTGERYLDLDFGGAALFGIVPVCPVQVAQMRL